MTSRGSNSMLLRYRGGEGQWAFIFHRVSGVAVWAFVLLHVLDIYLAGGNPALYDELLAFYASLPGRVMEALLGAALLYHALNGMRIIVMDIWPALTRWHRQIWYGTWAVFAVVGVVVSYFIFKPLFEG